MKYIQQFDNTDCGAACLAMIASYFGKKLSIAKIREKSGTNLIGTNVKGLVIAAESYGLKAFAVKGTKESINTNTTTPFIAHLNIVNEDDKTDWKHHYVIVKKISTKKITIWDPDPLEKKKKISIEQFLKWWTGYAVFFQPDDIFKKTEKKENLILKFLPVFAPYKKILCYSLICSSILLILGIIASFYYKYVFDEVIFSKTKLTLTTLSLGVLIVSFFQVIVGVVRTILLSHFSYKTDLQFNFSYLSHIFKLPLSFFETRKSGEILSRLGDLGKVKGSLSSIAISGIMDVILLLVSGPVLWHIHSKLFLISILTLLITCTISILFASIYKKYYSKVMSQNADVESYLYESINGVATVKALNAEDFVYEEYEKKKMIANETSWHLNNIGISQNLISGIIDSACGIFIFWLGSSSIIDGTLSFGTLLTFNSLLDYFTGPLFRLVNFQNDMQEALVAAKRVGEILDLDKEQTDDKNYLKPQKFEGSIKFENITFAYGTRKPVYENLNLEILPNSWTAFVGPSGCGKSTFVKLILKFYEIQKGKIYLDGNDINDIDTKYLRSQIGYVPQDIFLFSGTIVENVKLHHPEASLEEVIEACKKAGADEFIQKLPKRYETILGEHGGGLSGGEKQRLALARALLGNPSMLILDEATSSLDTVSEMEIHKVIKQLKKENISVILIAHRLTTVMNCDKIFVMNEGKIIQQGTHKELLKQEGLYKELWSEVNDNVFENL